MEKPKVLIGIVTFNRLRLLEKAIESSIQQDYPNFSIAVFDNASSYENIIHHGFFDRIDYIKSDVKLTIVEAKNRLMTSFVYDYFVWLDDDAYFMDSNAISKSIDFMESKRDVGALALDIFSPDNFISLYKDIIPVEKAVFVGCGCVLRFSAIEKSNFYAETIGYYGGEEQDLCLRMLEQGFTVYFYPGIRVWHEKSKEGRDEFNQWRSQVCNSFSSLLKYYPIFILFFIIPYRFFRLGIFSYQHGILKKYFSGCLFFVRTFKLSLSNRNPVSFSTVIKFHKLLKLDI